MKPGLLDSNVASPPTPLLKMRGKLPTPYMQNLLSDIQLSVCAEAA
jgi:hypothetical protein